MPIIYFFFCVRGILYLATLVAGIKYLLKVSEIGRLIIRVDGLFISLDVTRQKSLY